ncbi:alpha/beta fold hydrolase [Pseudoduganella sp. GCM10020061]|uniref:alpha/beta fold hydrolase n=1 Tax=Pseudoduganella sp. GCM10020061 TaxID=3317345 RepID=UPI0036256936
MSLTAAPAESLPVVVLLHSSMSSQSQWNKLVARESGRYRFVAVDLLGYGRSPFPLEPDSFTLGHEVDAVMASIAAHVDTHEPLHLVGHSYGGATALRLARELGPRVRSLCVFEPVAFHLLPQGSPARTEIVAVVASIEAAPTRTAAARSFIDYWNGAGTFDTLPEAQQARFAAQIDKVKLDFQALLGEPATLADCAQLDMPALVLSGSASPRSTREVAAQLASALGDARSAQVAGGHMAPITHADAVNELIGEFLREHALEAAGAAL